MEAEFLHQDMPVEMLVERNEGIVYLVIIGKDFMEKLHPTRQFNVWECGFRSLIVDTASYIFN